ncbi:MAG: hypothetical protein M1835_005645 [Candelina submexicana]|nr:MAG: hypothetical protein M1835_005645 [Candelina submexicana]
MALVVAGKAPLKPVIVSFPNHDTPDSVIAQAKDAILADGGVITHEFSLIKGFSANAAEEVLNTVQTFGSPDNHPVVENDELVTAYSDSR